MGLNYSPAEIAFRDRVRAWLRANLPDDLPEKVVNYQELERNDYVRWHKILAQKGWGAPEWPVEWGGALTGPSCSATSHPLWPYHVRARAVPLRHV